MPNHLIITCGTSQIDGDKIDPTDLDSFLEDVRVDPHPESCYREDVEKAVGRLKQEFLAEKHVTQLGKKKNPFGGEVSTLTVMQRDGKWDPTQDTITILRSETNAGWFAAKVLYGVLTECWGVDENSIELVIIKGLQTQPEKPDDVMNELANQIIDHLKDKRDNIFVMTGGFKSIIPCLTVFSLISGIELVYLFETSDTLQSLHPKLDLKDRKVLELWKETWTEMLEKGYGAGTAKYLKRALEWRIENDGIYSSFGE